MIPIGAMNNVPRSVVMARLDRAITLFIALLLMARSSRAMTIGVDAKTNGDGS